MSRIDERQDKIIRDFLEVGDAFDQYAYLIELSVMLPGLPEEKKTEDRLVKGCQSSVWLDMRAQNGIFEFDADSDTLILKGILYLLRDILNGQTAEEVARADIRFLAETDIMTTFGSDRQKGIGYITRKIKRFAAESSAAAK